MMAKRNASEGSQRFVRLVIPDHIHKVDQWCIENGGISAPKAISLAIEKAREIPELEAKINYLEDRLKVMEIIIKERKLIWSEVREENDEK